MNTCTKCGRADPYAGGSFQCPDCAAQWVASMELKPITTSSESFYDEIVRITLAAEIDCMKRSILRAASKGKRRTTAYLSDRMVSRVRYMPEFNQFRFEWSQTDHGYYVSWEHIS